jgi:hypothetical protein
MGAVMGVIVFLLERAVMRGSRKQVMREKKAA